MTTLRVVHVYSRKEPGKKQKRGILLTGRRFCRLEGCTGQRMGVRWPGGKVTWPCSKGMKSRSNGDWEIL